MSDGSFLHRYFLNNAHKRLHKYVHYFDIYERHFARFRDQSPTIVEIGVQGGGSLAMWKAYFGAGAQVIGVDIAPDCKRHEGPGVEVFIGSQDDPAVVEQIFERFPKIDIIIDDGSHQMDHMNASFAMMYHRMSPNGVYLAEDAHSCYRASFGGGVKREGSFMEMVKDKIDELNASYTHGEIPVSEFTCSTDAICVYDSVVVFERRPQGARQAVITDGLVPEGRDRRERKRKR